MVSWSRKLEVLVLGLALVAMVVAFTGCPKPIEEEPVMVEEPMGEQVGEPMGEPFKVGGIFDTTGKAAALGEPERDTAKMIEEQVNSAGGIDGRPLEIIIRDTKGEETEALKAVKELIEKENVLAVVGPSRSGTTLGIIDYIEKSETPLVSCAAAVKITTPVKKWVFKTPQTDAHAVETIYKYLNEQNISKVAALTASNAFGEGGLEQLKGQAEAAGITVVAEEQFADADKDMTAQLTKIKGTDAEAVVCWGIGPAPSLIAKKVTELQMGIPLIMSHGVANKKFIEGAGDAANGVVFPAGRLIVADQLPEDDPQKETLLKYAEDFRAKYDRDPDTFGGHAWDAVHLVVMALKEVGEDKEGIRAAIESTTDFTGIGGIFNYSAEDHYGLTAEAFVMVVIEDGEWKLIAD